MFRAFVITLIFSVLSLSRLMVVYGARMRALHMALLASVHATSLGEGEEECRRCFNILNEYGSYGCMLLDLTKWRFEDFYPDLERRQRE